MQIDPKKKELSGLKTEEIPSPEHVKQMIEATRNTRDEALIMTLWDTGGRISEVLNLEWKDLEIESSSEEKNVYYLRFTESKTMPRRVPLSDCVPSLRKWMDQHPRPEPGQPVFTKFEGNKATKEAGLKPLNYGAARASIKRVRKKASIDSTVKTNPHAFRKGRATFMAAAGMQANAMMEHFGWHSIETAEKYISLARDQLTDAYKSAVGIEDDKKSGVELDQECLKPGRCRTCNSLVSAAWSYCHGCGDTIEGDNLLSMLEESGSGSSNDLELERIKAKIEQINEIAEANDIDLDL